MLTLTKTSFGAIFGNSLTEQDDFWHLRQRYWQNYRGVSGFTGMLLKEGLSGDTAAHGAGIVPSVLGGLHPVPNACIVEYGTNDLGGSSSTYQTNMTTLVTNLMGGNLNIPAASILIVGIMGAASTNRTTLANFNAAAQAVVAANPGMTFADTATPFHLLIDGGGPDPTEGLGVHPTDTIQTFPAVTGAPGGTMSGKQWFSQVVEAYVTFG